jgi:hypothetical protein
MRRRDVGCCTRGSNVHVDEEAILRLFAGDCAGTKLTISGSDPSWLKLVRTSAAAGNGFEGLAEIVGEGVDGGDGLPSGLDLYGPVAAGGLNEFPD